jgi:hypothetical protein
VKKPNGEFTSTVDETMKYILDNVFPDDSKQTDSNSQAKLRFLLKFPYKAKDDPLFTMNELSEIIKYLHHKELQVLIA